MKIALYAGDFAGAGRSEWLLDDLAAALAERGHSVDVILFDTKAGRVPGRRRSPTDLFDIVSLGPALRRSGVSGRISAMLGTAVRLRRHARSVRPGAYDLALFTSVAMMSWGAPGILRRRKGADRLALVLWDFFPIHNVEIGRLRRSPLIPLLRRCEALAMRSADTVAVMSAANERFLRSYFPRMAAHTVIVPPWASAEPPAEREATSVFQVIFGGQLVKGRGVDTLLHAVSALQDAGSAVELIIAGDGPERSGLEDLARRLKLDCVVFTGALPRDEYREVLAGADLGIAVTVSGVTPPTFPSKIVEYCAAGVPVVVCVETASDAHEWLEEAGAGLGAEAGSATSLASAIAEFRDRWARGGSVTGRRAARRLFEEKLSVQQAVLSFERLAGDSVKSDL